MNNAFYDGVGDNEAVKMAVKSEYCERLYSGKNMGEGLVSPSTEALGAD